MKTESSKMVSLRTALGLGLAMISVAMGTFFVGVYTAHAVPGGETRPFLSFAGTLRGASGAMTFTFHKPGAADCTAMTTPVTPDATTGAFSVEVPFGTCPSSLFDGSDVTFDVSVGGATIARSQRVNPVPYARYADTVGTPDCPATYTRDATATGIILCRRGNDEVVRVGDGNSAFWIDRYEASVWSAPSAMGSALQFGGVSDDYPSGFPDNGQWTTQLYAVSRAGVMPSRFITWFQASEACAANGKRLPTNTEWQRAARGTPDPTTPSDGSGARCVTSSSGPRMTGGGGACASMSGAQDMIGNEWEWTDEWYAGVGDTGPATPNAMNTNGWGVNYNGDATHNVMSTAYPGPRFGVPSAGLRGGHWGDGGGAGAFALSVNDSPSSQLPHVGFRCVIPR